jgi:hypothetical protein
VLLLCIAALGIEGCMSNPLGGAARKSGANEPALAAESGDWPGDAERDQSRGKPRYHRARPGESFADVAALYGMTVPQLLSSNHGLDPADGLKPGQLIYVPRQ